LRGALAMLLLLGAQDAAGAPAPEYAVKAAYLSKLGLFVEWPKSAFATPASPLVLCVAGDNPFGDTLDKVAEGQHVAEHPIAVRYLKTVNRDAGCDILYVADADARSVGAALAAVSGTGVLTITDASRLPHGGGIVEFVVQDNRVRFNIDEQAAAQNGITISAHLLSLALNVKAKP
jgi:hypothetical protein